MRIEARKGGRGGEPFIEKQQVMKERGSRSPMPEQEKRPHRRRAHQTLMEGRSLNRTESGEPNPADSKACPKRPSARPGVTRRDRAPRGRIEVEHGARQGLKASRTDLSDPPSTSAHGHHSCRARRAFRILRRSKPEASAAPTDRIRTKYRDEPMQGRESHEIAMTETAAATVPGPLP